MKKVLVLLVVFCTLSAMIDKKPKVLILGDSVSMGYTRFAKEKLESIADVYRPDDNCGGTTKGVQFIDQWLKINGGNWDVIHFNFGLHDLKHVDPKTGLNSINPNDPQQADVKTYIQNLEAMIIKMKATGAQLIFATTTPYPKGTTPYRDPDMAVAYNKAALELCEKYDIKVDDLYSLVEHRLKELQRPLNVHFKPNGSKLLGYQVAESIIQVLKTKK